MKTLLILVVSLLIGSTQIFAQNSKAGIFKLKNKEGHYYFQTKINQTVKTRILLESGIHVMLVDSSFAFKHKEALGLSFTPNPIEQKVNLGERRYRITHKAKGKIMLNDMTSYEGEFFILANYASYNDIAVPIQKLQNTIDHSCIAKLDMKEYTFQLISKEDYLAYQKHKVFKINYDTYLNMPAIRTKLLFEQDGQSYMLHGNFVLDLGNASFLALMKQSPQVKEFLKANAALKLQKGYNRKGVVVAEAMATERAELCDIDFANQIIVVTSVLPKFTSEGLIGLKFFNNFVSIFNFESSEFVIF